MYVPLHRARFFSCVVCTPCVFVFPCRCSSRRGTISLTQLVLFCLQHGECPFDSAFHPPPIHHPPTYQVVESFGSIFQEEPSAVGKVMEESCSSGFTRQCIQCPVTLWACSLRRGEGREGAHLPSVANTSDPIRLGRVIVLPMPSQAFAAVLSRFPPPPPPPP